MTRLAADDERWLRLVPERTSSNHWNPENWVRSPGDYPDFPPSALRRVAGWSRPLRDYLDGWYRFLAGLTDEPPLPSQATGRHHLAVAQREWRKRNGYPEPTPVEEMRSSG